MFFTGCGSSSLMTGTGFTYKEVQQQIMETQENREKLGEAGLLEGETMAASEMPDFYEEKDGEKFANLEGVPAFKISDGHSSDIKDIELFEVKTLFPDGTFLYYYTTRLINDPQRIVHCVATHNYKTGEFHVIHEKDFQRLEEEQEDEESFFVQLYKEDGTGDLFVYDNKCGYIYEADADTNDAKFSTDIETFVRQHFDGHSIIVTGAHLEERAKGELRVYVDLVIEKDEIVIEEEAGDVDETEISEEDADEEAEDLDAEFADKTIETVLIYDFQPYTSTIDQVNLRFDEQKDKWETMRNVPAGYLNWTPPAEDDWNSVVQDIPSEWGTAYLYGLEKWSTEKLEEHGIEEEYISGTPVFQWTGAKQFGQLDEYRSDLKPKSGTYQPFMELDNNMELSNVFVLMDGHYYELCGKTDQGLGEGDYAPVGMHRTVIRVDETTNEDGTTSRSEPVEISQSLEKPRKRDTSLTDCYLEGYWLMDEVHSVFDVVNGEIFCTEALREDDTEYDVIKLLKADGNLAKIVKVESESMVDLFQDDGALYMTVAKEGWTNIQRLQEDEDNGWKTGGSSQDVMSEMLADSLKTVEYRMVEVEGKEGKVKVKYRPEEVDSRYHDAYQDLGKDEDGNLRDDRAGEYLDGENLLHVSLAEPKTELLQKIEDYQIAELTERNPEADLETLKQSEEYKKADVISEIAGDGYLVTSFAHGLLYFDTAAQRAVCLDEGTWYKTWRMGDQLVSVGFGKEASTYGVLDLAFARVMEYKLDEQYTSRLEAIADSLKDLLEIPYKETNEGVTQMQKELEETRAGEELIIVKPEVNEWKDNTPGDELKQKEEERQQKKEEERKKKEEAGEWTELDELFYQRSQEEEEE